MGYLSDLSKEEWEVVAHFFAPRDRRGSASKHDRKHVVDAILYVAKTGVQWRMLPRDFPPWKTVYDHFRRWNQRGVWEQALDALNARHRKKRHADPRPATASSIRKASRPSTPVKHGASTAGKK